jgi:Ca2+-transporting ATPase
VDDSSATEKAMLLFMKGVGEDVEAKRAVHLPENFVRFHFTSKRKKMGTILSNIKDNAFGYDKRVHMKGASEIVLANCTKWMNQDGQVNELDDGMK